MKDNIKNKKVVVLILSVLIGVFCISYSAFAFFPTDYIAYTSYVNGSCMTGAVETTIVNGVIQNSSSYNSIVTNAWHVDTQYIGFDSTVYIPSDVHIGSCSGTGEYFLMAKTEDNTATDYPIPDEYFGNYNHGTNIDVSSFVDGSYWYYGGDGSGVVNYLFFTMVSGVATIDTFEGYNTSGLEFSSPTIAQDFYTNDILFEGTYSGASAYNKILIWVVDSNGVGTGSFVDISGDSGSFEKTISLLDGSYYYTARFFNSNNYTYGGWYPNENSNARTFVVGEIPITYDTCETFNIACYLQNAFIYLFTPTGSSIAQFKSLTLRDSAPFSYLYDMGNLWNQLFSNSGSSDYSLSVTTGLGNISFISRAQIESVPFTSTIKTIITALLYMFTALTVYKLLLKSHS